MITKTHVLQTLSRHIGRANGISMLNLVRECHALVHPSGFEPVASVEAMGRHIRDLIVELRLDGEHICAHPSAGYYMAATPEELNDTCKFLVDRSVTGLRQVAAMKKVALPDLYGQLKLPT